MKTSNRLRRAVSSAILSEFDGGNIEIADAGAKRLVILPFPALKAKAEASGDAAAWTAYAADGGFLASGDVGKEIVLDRTDIQWGGTVSVQQFDIPING